jgi:hypothetical protein
MVVLDCNKDIGISDLISQNRKKTEDIFGFVSSERRIKYDKENR